MRKLVNAMACVCLSWLSSAHAQEGGGAGGLEPQWDVLMRGCLTHSPQDYCEKQVAKERYEWRADYNRLRQQQEEAEKARAAHNAEWEAEQRAMAEKIQKEADERNRRLDLEDKRAPYRQAIIAARQPQILASAHLCDLRQSLASAQESIRQEKEAAKYSGVVDKSVLYQAGQEIRDYTNGISQVTTALKRTTKKSPLPCTNEAARNAQWHFVCSLGEARCTIDAREARDLVLDWFEGGPDPKDLEAERRKAVDPAYPPTIEEWAKRLAESAGKAVVASTPMKVTTK